MKKEIILCGLFTILTIALIIVYILSNNRGPVLEKTQNVIIGDKNNKNNKEKSEENPENKNLTFVDNQIILTLNDNTTREYVLQLANDIDARIIQEIEVFHDYTLEFNNKKFSSMDEVIQYCGELEKKYLEIELCNANNLSYSD